MRRNLKNPSIEVFNDRVYMVVVGVTGVHTVTHDTKTGEEFCPCKGFSVRKTCRHVDMIRRKMLDYLGDEDW